MSRFEKTTHFTRMGDFELVLSSKHTVDELHVAFHFASLAASVLEMHLCKVQNHYCTGFEKNDNSTFTTGVYHTIPHTNCIPTCHKMADRMG